MLVLHHNDIDGRCSAAIVKKWWKVDGSGYDLRFVEMDYNKQIPFDMIKEDEQVVIVDFSLKPDDFRKLQTITKHIVWIDHHVTCKGYDYAKESICGLRDFGENRLSGCELTWRYFYKYELTPLFISLIGDYDAWRLELPFHFEFYEGLKLRDTDPCSDTWSALFENEEELTAKIINEGAIAINYRNNYCKDLAKSYGYETEIDGHKAFATNMFRFGSQGFGEKFNEYDMCLAYIHDGSKFVVSLYSEKIDVSVIAKAHGGGGHKGAAGFVCNELPFKRKD